MIYAQHNGDKEKVLNVWSQAVDTGREMIRLQCRSRQCLPFVVGVTRCQSQETAMADEEGVDHPWVAISWRISFE